MAEFMERFDYGKEQPHQHKILRLHHTVDQVGGEIGPVCRANEDSRPDEETPEGCAPPGEERTDERGELLQEPFRINQGKLPGEKVHEPTLPFALSLLFVAVEQLGGVRYDIALQHVRRMELTQQLDDVRLGWSFIAEL